MWEMSSRARGIWLGRRPGLPSQEIGPQIGHCEKNRVMVVGKPDKMAARSPNRLRSRVIASLRERFGRKLQVLQLRWKTFATRLSWRWRCCFVAGEVHSLCEGADNMHLAAWPPLGWAG